MNPLGFLAPDCHDLVRQKMASGDEGPYEVRGLRKDGTTLPIEICGKAVSYFYEGRQVRVGVSRDISERRRAEEALRASEERWRSLVQNSPDVIMNVARDGTLVLINRTLSGFPPPEQMVGASVYEFIPPQDHDTMRGALERAFQTGEPDSFEIAGSGPRRTISYYACRLAPVEYDGQVASVNLIATDITERKRAEQALRESEERFRRLSEATPEGIFIHDGERVLDANPQAAATHGYELSEFIGMEIWDFIAPDCHDLVRQQLRSGHEGPYEARGLRKDGTTFPMELCGKTASYKGNQVRVGVMRDISERRRAEQALRESEERFRRLSEATLEGIVIHDGERILDANPQAAAMVGYELSELIGMDAWRFLAPDYHDLVRQQLRSEYGESYEVRGLRKDGTTFPMEVCGKTVSYEGRQVRVGVMRDISERKRAEEAAQAAREDLEAKAEQRMVAAGRYNLTFRELTVLYLIAAGSADKEIAFQLGISPRTASKHVENILQKMGVASRTGAGLRAVRESLVDDAR
jgi:PAS domain S-box-containing protein